MDLMASCVRVGILLLKKSVVFFLFSCCPEEDS